MAHAILKLDEKRRANGAALLQMLDDVEFGALGAAWVYSEEADYWRYLIVTPMVDSKGPEWIHRRLLQMFAKLRLPDGITPLDIIVASPYEHAILDLMSVRSLRPLAKGQTLKRAMIAGRTTSFVFSYRVSSNDVQSPDASLSFDLRVRQLSAA